MSREVLQMALEAGYKDLPTVRLAYQGFDIQHFTNLVIAAERHRVLAEERAALPQPYPEYDRGFSNGWDKCAERQAVQQEHPKQMARLGWQYVECPACGSEGARAFPKPEEEPVAWLRADGMKAMEADEKKSWIDSGNPELVAEYIIPLFTAPPQRQPLTDEQIAEIAERMEATDVASSFWRDFVRAVEAAHGTGEKT